MYRDILLVEDVAPIVVGLVVELSWGGGIVTQTFPTTQGILSIFAATVHKLLLSLIEFLNFILNIPSWWLPPIIMTKQKMKITNYKLDIVP